MTTPTDAELIEWLRLCDTAYKLHAPAVAEGQRLAADRLAALSEEVEELTADRDRLENMCEEAGEKLERLRGACQADAEMIHRLRNVITPDLDTDAVADRLAALSKEVEELTADRDRLEGMCVEVGEKLARVSAESDEMHTELERLNWEVMRLREALEKYADAMNWHCTEFGEYHEHSEKCCKDGWWTRSEHGYDVAREALKETNP